jgi:truncated hemoglobin YjbI
MTDQDNRTIETRYDAVDWDGLLAEVQSRFNYLRLAWRTSEHDATAHLHAKMVKELYLPCIELLAQFCAAIEVEEEDQKGPMK